MVKQLFFRGMSNFGDSATEGGELDPWARPALIHAAIWPAKGQQHPFRFNLRRRFLTAMINELQPHPKSNLAPLQLLTTNELPANERLPYT